MCVFSENEFSLRNSGQLKKRNFLAITVELPARLENINLNRYCKGNKLTLTGISSLGVDICSINCHMQIQKVDTSSFNYETDRNRYVPNRQQIYLFLPSSC